MRQANFRGEQGAYHIECHECGVDLHLLNWDRREDDREPLHCPYCGSEDIWYADEAVRTSGSAA